MPGIDANTKLMLHFNGADGNTEIIDDGNTGHTPTAVATAQIDTSDKQFGSGSLLLDGNSDYLTIPDSPDWDILASNVEDWTIDLWAKLLVPPIQNTFVGQHQVAGVNYWHFATAGSGVVRFNVGIAGAFNNVTDGTINIEDNVWHHIALCKVGTNVGIYVDGVQDAYRNITDTVTYNGDLFVGVLGTLGSHMNGQMDELRIQKSNIFSASPNVGKTDTITVPTAAHVANANTKLLLHFNSHDVSGDGGSGVYHVPNFVATAQIDTLNKKFGSGSLLLDGNSDYISIPDSPDWDINLNNTDIVTIDYWMKTDAFTGSEQYPMGHGTVTSGAPQWKFGLGPTGSFRLAYTSNAFAWDTDTPGPGEVVLGVWQHICAVIKGNGTSRDIGLYVDGVQIGYANPSLTSSVSGNFEIGRSPEFPTVRFFGGQIDEVRFQRSNIFNASPNVGLTDTIVVPSAEYDSLAQAARRKVSQSVIIIT